MTSYGVLLVYIYICYLYLSFSSPSTKIYAVGLVEEPLPYCSYQRWKILLSQQTSDARAVKNEAYGLVWPTAHAVAVWSGRTPVRHDQYGVGSRIPSGENDVLDN